MTKNFIFDFDSTIFPGESLDEIIQLGLQNKPNAEELSAEVKKICNQGMSGEIDMSASLQKRLAIASPNAEIIENYIRQNKARIDKRISQLLIQLVNSTHRVFVISGGFEEWIIPILNNVVPNDTIHANRIINHSRPMTFDNIIRRDKEDILNELKQSGEIIEGEIIMVGDGATDFRVFNDGLAQKFIGTFFYTGLSARKKVVEQVQSSKQTYFDNLENFIDYMSQFVNAKG